MGISTDIKGELMSILSEILLQRTLLNFICVYPSPFLTLLREFFISLVKEFLFTLKSQNLSKRSLHTYKIWKLCLPKKFDENFFTMTET